MMPMQNCTYLAEQEQQVWAAEMLDHLLAMHHSAQEWCLEKPLRIRNA